MVQSSLVIEQAVQSGIKSYLSHLRDQVDPFVDKHFCFESAWSINKKALGYDLLKAPANVLWAPLHFTLEHAGKGIEKIGFSVTGKQLQSLPSGFSTEVEREVQWRIYTEFLRLPIDQKDRSFHDNGLLEHILAQPELVSILESSLTEISELALSSSGKSQLEANLMAYVESRKAASELSSTLIATATTFATTKSLSLGTLGLGQALATSATAHAAVSSFALGKTLGGLYYSIMPVSASTSALILSTGGVAALLGVVSAFSGVVSDPIQGALGLHQKRLRKLVDALEIQLTSNEEGALELKDAYVARVIDLLDVLTLAVKKIT